MEYVRSVVIFVVVVLMACNSVYELAPTYLVDARPDGFVCSHGVPFGAGTPVPIDSAYGVEAARFNRERTIAYLSLCLTIMPRAAGCDLYLSPFTTTTASFNQFTKLSGVSTPD